LDAPGLGDGVLDGVGLEVGLTWQRCKYMNEAADPAEWQKASVPEVPWSV
jgi:hypothetical protein